jgi:hypothetical protein
VEVVIHRFHVAVHRFDHSAAHIIDKIFSHIFNVCRDLVQVLVRDTPLSHLVILLIAY